VRLTVSAGPVPSGPASIAALYEERVTSSRYPDICYRVRLLADGIWECACPAVGYGSRMDGGCKHIDQVREKYEFARSFAGLLHA